MTNLENINSLKEIFDSNELMQKYLEEMPYGYILLINEGGFVKVDEKTIRLKQKNQHHL